MRKYVIGFLVGALFASAIPAYGAVSTLVGKKITNEYPVVVNGEQLSAKAIAINGVSYAPNRAIAEALGSDVAFVNKKVIITGGEVVAQTELEQIYIRLGEIDKELKAYIRKKTQLMADYMSPTADKVKIESEVQVLESHAGQLKTEKDGLELRKAELESQATPTPTPTP